MFRGSSHGETDGGGGNGGGCSVNAERAGVAAQIQLRLKYPPRRKTRGANSKAVQRRKPRPTPRQKQTKREPREKRAQGDAPDKVRDEKGAKGIRMKTEGRRPPPKVD